MLLATVIILLAGIGMMLWAAQFRQLRLASPLFENGLLVALIGLALMFVASLWEALSIIIQWRAGL